MTQRPLRETLLRRPDLVTEVGLNKQIPLNHRLLLHIYLHAVVF